MGAPLAGSDVRAQVLTGGGFRLKGLVPRYRSRRLQMIFPLRGAEHRGLVSLEAKRRRVRLMLNSDSKLLGVPHVDLPKIANQISCLRTSCSLLLRHHLQKLTGTAAASIPSKATPAAAGQVRLQAAGGGCADGGGVGPAAVPGRRRPHLPARLHHRRAARSLPAGLLAMLAVNDISSHFVLQPHTCHFGPRQHVLSAVLCKDAVAVHMFKHCLAAALMCSICSPSAGAADAAGVRGGGRGR